MRIETVHRVTHPRDEVLAWYDRPGALVHLTPPGLAGADDPATGGMRAGRLVGVEKNGAPAATYAYDAFGRRVQKDPAVGSTTHFVYDPDGRLLAESTGSGVPEREYIWLPLDGQAWALPIASVTASSTSN